MTSLWYTSDVRRDPEKKGLDIRITFVLESTFAYKYGDQERSYTETRFCRKLVEAHCRPHTPARIFLKQECSWFFA